MKPVSTIHRTACIGAERPLPALIVLVSLLLPASAKAQGAGCIVQATAAPARQVLRCQDGLTLEAEAGADYTVLDRNRDGAPDAASLRNRALYIDASPRSRRNSFQVLTPQAIAAVRGTQWAVDVVEGKTSVFVVTGRVDVRRTNASRGVSLGPGEGVDVEAGTAPLTVRRWPIARANALLARFGRRIQQ